MSEFDLATLKIEVDTTDLKTATSQLTAFAEASKKVTATQQNEATQQKSISKDLTAYHIRNLQSSMQFERQERAAQLAMRTDFERKGTASERQERSARLAMEQDFTHRGEAILKSNLQFEKDWNNARVEDWKRTTARLSAERREQISLGNEIISMQKRALTQEGLRKVSSSTLFAANAPLIQQPDVYAAAGIKSPQQRIGEINSLKSAMAALSAEHANGNVTGKIYNETMREMHGRMNLLTEGNSRHRGAIRQTAAAMASLTFEMTGAIYGVLALGAALASPALFGTAMLKRVEDAKTGVAGILISMGELNGKALTFGQAWAASGQYVKQVQQDSMKYGIDMGRLMEVNQAAISGGLNAMLTLEQIQKVATAGAIAVSSLGLNSQQYVQEVRDLISGGIQPASSTLARSIGVTDALLKQWKAEGPDKLIKELTDRLQGFLVVADEVRSKTLTGAWDILQARLSMLLSDEDGFGAIKKAVLDVANYIGKVDEVSKKFTLNPNAVATAKSYWEVLKLIGGVFEIIGDILKRVSPLVAKLAQGIRILMIEAKMLVTFASTAVNQLLALARLDFSGFKKAGADGAESIKKMLPELENAARAFAGMKQSANDAASAQDELWKSITGASTKAIGVEAYLETLGMQDKAAKAHKEYLQKRKDAEVRFLAEQVAIGLRYNDAFVAIEELKLAKIADAKKRSTSGQSQSGKVTGYFDKEIIAKEKEVAVMMDELNKLSGAYEHRFDTIDTKKEKHHQSEMMRIGTEMQAHANSAESQMTNVEKVSLAWTKMDDKYKTRAEALKYVWAIEQAMAADKRKADDEFEKISKSISDLNNKEIADIDAKIVAQQKHNDEIGKSAEQKAIAAEATEQLLIKQMELEASAIHEAANTVDMDKSYKSLYINRANALDIEIAKRKELAGLKGQAAILEASDAANKAEIKAQEKKWKMIDGFAHTAFNNILDKGQNVFKEIGDAIKKYLLDMLYKMTVQKFLINVGVIGGTTASANAMAIGGESAGSRIGIDSGIKAIGSSASNFLFGSSGTTVAATGAAADMGPAAITTGAADGLFMTSGGALTATGIGAVAAIGGVILAKYGFGWGNQKEYSAQRMEGTVGVGGINARMAQDWTLDNGWFGGTSRGTDYSEMSKAIKNKVKYSADQVQQIFIEYGKSIGDATIATKYYSTDVNDLANGIGMQLVPALEEFRMEGETLVDTAKRMTDAINKINSVITSTQNLAIEQLKASVDAKNALFATAASIRDFVQSIGTKTLSVLKSSFEEINTQAAGGNVAAQGKLQDSATSYLQEAKSSARSSIEYSRSEANVRRALSQTASSIEHQATDAELQLGETKTSNEYLKDISLSLQYGNLTTSAMRLALDAGNITQDEMRLALAAGNVTTDAMHTAFKDGNITQSEMKVIDKSISDDIALGNISAGAAVDLQKQIKKVSEDSLITANESQVIFDMIKEINQVGNITQGEMQAIDKAISNDVKLGNISASDALLIQDKIKIASENGFITAIESQDIYNAIKEINQAGNITRGEMQTIDKAIADDVKLGNISASDALIIQDKIKVASEDGVVTANESQDIYDAIKLHTLDTVDNTSGITNAITALQTAMVTMLGGVNAANAVSGLTANVGLENMVGKDITQGINAKTGGATASVQIDRYNTKTAESLGGVTTFSTYTNQALITRDANIAAKAAAKKAYEDEVASPVREYVEPNGGRLTMASAENRYKKDLPKLIAEEEAKVKAAYDYWQSLPEFAIGTNSVPYDMNARVHEGERIIPAADNRQLMSRIAANDETANEVKNLRAELQAIGLALAKNTGEAAKILRKFDGDGMPAERVLAA